MKKIISLILALIFTGGILKSQVLVTGGPTISYTSLGAAFAAINAGTHTGAITIDISATITETASAVLNSSGSGSANYTSVLIFPSVDGVVINGAATAAAGRGVIELNGADNVTINGDNPNTPGTNRNLTIVNNNANTVNYASVIRIATAAGTGFTDANNNTITNLILNGNATGLNVAGNTSTTGPQNTTFGIVAGPNGGSVIGNISSVTTGMASGMPVNNLVVNNNAIDQCARGIAFLGNTTAASSNSITISNNVIGANITLSGSYPYTSPVTTVYAKGMYLQGATAINIFGNTIKNVFSYVGTTVTSMEFSSTTTGAGGIAVTNNTITGICNNGVGGSSVRAINFASTSSSATYTISSNILNNIQCNSTTLPAGIYISTSATSGLIEKNRISKVYNNHVGTWGIRGLELAGGSNVTVRNNFIWDINEDITGGGFSTTYGVFGISVSSGTGHKILHNTVSLSGTAVGTNSLLSSALSIVNTSQTGMDVRNNILSNTLVGGSTANAHVCIYLPSTATSAMNLLLNNNAYYTGTTANHGMAQLGTTAGTNFYLASNFIPSSTSPASNFRAFSSTLGNTSNDNSSFATTGAAPFISSTDLHISNATYNPLESGAAVTTVTTDIDADVRPGPVGSVNGGGTIPDIGADEFDGLVITTDLATTGLASPGVPPICYGPNQTVSVVIKNNGAASIDFALNNATISAAATGVNPQVFPNVVLNSGTLTAGSSQTVVVSTTYNMSTAGTYSFNASVAVTGDGNSANDAMGVATRTVIAPVALPQQVDFTGFTGANLTTVFPNWYEASGATVPVGTTSTFTYNTGLSAVGNITARVNLFGNTKNEWIVGPKILAASNTAITFDAAVTDWNSIVTADAMGSDDKVRVMVSNDCGVTFVPVFTVSATNSLSINLTNFSVPLGAYAGQEIIVAFQASEGSVNDPEDYDFHLDNINILNLPMQDAGISSLTAPATSGCYGASENLVVTINNYGAASITNVPVTVIVSGAATQTSNAVYTGTIPSSASASFTVGTLNMTAFGTYSFNAFTSLPGDGNSVNDNMPVTTRTNVAPVSLPQTVSFTGYTGANLTTVFPNWYEAAGATVPVGTTSSFTYQTGLNGAGNITARVNLFSNTKNEWIVGPKLTATANSKLSFDAAVTDWNSITVGDVMGSDDKVRVMISTDCGTSYAPVFTISATNSLSTTFTNFSISLSAYAGQDIIIGFQASEGTVNDPEDYDFHLDNINICNLPTVTVAATPTVICNGDPVTLSASGASTYSWSTSSSSSSITVTPSVTTTYTVDGTDACGTDTRTISVTVNANPTVSAVASSSAICTGSSATLTASGASTYSWTGVGAGSSVVVSPSAGTTYTVEGTDVNGCKTINTISLGVNPNPTITAISNPTAVCIGNSATLTASGANTYSWTGVGAGASVVVNPTSGTTYTVEGTDVNGCKNINMLTLGVNPNPTITAASSASAVCIGNSATLTASGANTYSWTGVGSGSSVVVTPTTATSYTVEGTDVNGCMDIITVSLAVNPNPTVTAMSSPTAICAGNSTTLTASGANTYSWTGVGAGSSVVVTPTTATSYTVEGTDVNGCMDIISINVVVNPGPTVTAMSSPTAVCSGNSTTLTASGANTYSWTGVGSGSSVVVTPTAAATYTVEGTDVNGCMDIITINVNVNPNPSVSAITSASILCVGDSATLTASGALTYSWTGVGSGASVVVNPTVTTTYTVEGTDSNGCLDTISITQVVSLCTGIENILAKSNGIMIFPNPSNGIMTLVVTDISQSVKLEIYDALGKQVMSKEISAHQTEINISEMADGIYSFRVMTNSQIIKQGKLVKE